MKHSTACDFCGRSETNRKRLKIKMDEDGLLVCSDCRGKLTSTPTGEMDGGGEMDESIQALVGKSAGAICRTLALPYEPPYQLIIDAASRIAYDEDRYMSTWSFTAQWLDGTTVWLSEDRRTKAIVPEDGEVRIVERT